MTPRVPSRATARKSRRASRRSLGIALPLRPLALPSSISTCARCLRTFTEETLAVRSVL